MSFGAKKFAAFYFFLNSKSQVSHFPLKYPNEKVMQFVSISEKTSSRMIPYVRNTSVSNAAQCYCGKDDV